MKFLATRLSREKVSEDELKEYVDTINAAVQTAEEAARKAKAAMDKFLKESGIAFGGWSGPSTEKTHEPIILGGSNAEFRWRFLGIRTGILVNTYYAPLRYGYEYAKLSIIQICLNLRWDYAMTYGITVFGGVGMNVAASSLEADSVVNEMTDSIIGFKVVLGKVVELYVGYQFNQGKGSITVTAYIMTIAENSITFLWV